MGDAGSGRDSKQQEKQPPAFEDIFVEPELFKEPHLSAVDIALPPKTPEIMADEECGSIASEAETAEVESSENEVSEAEPLESAPSKTELSADSVNEDNAAETVDVEQETAADSHIAKKRKKLRKKRKARTLKIIPPFSRRSVVRKKQNSDSQTSFPAKILTLTAVLMMAAILLPEKKKKPCRYNCRKTTKMKKQRNASRF